MTTLEFNALVRQYQGLVYTVCHQLVPDEGDAQDLAQETFLAAWRAIDRCPPGYEKQWLARIASNKAKDYLRSAWVRRVNTPGDDILALEGAPPGSDPEQQVLDAIHEARKSGGKRQFDLTTDTPERYVADQNKGDHVATQSVHRPNWLKVTVGRINEQFVIVLITDVSDVIRFAQVRDSFITNVSEQLLGPTEALAKLADSLESGNLDEQQVAADARRVRSSCSKLNHMVSDLLLLIRAQEPITPSSANRLNVMEQLRATAARLEPQAAEAGVQLNIKGDDDLVINGEADQIDSAVTKLIENAIGYSKENGVVSVSASKDKDGDRAVIRVIDQGTGIAKKDQARIFERFYRGVEQSNRTADGVGLGLAIVKHVALTHHGDVTVWSAPGQGSTFSLTLPLAQ